MFTAVALLLIVLLLLVLFGPAETRGASRLERTA